jgi:hypothetical protein
MLNWDLIKNLAKKSSYWKAERGLKTRHGEGHQRAFYPTAQATNNRRCPVNLYKVIAQTTPKPQTLRFSSQLIIRERQTHRFGTPKVHLGRTPLGCFL